MLIKSQKYLKGIEQFAWICSLKKLFWSCYLLKNQRKNLWSSPFIIEVHPEFSWTLFSVRNNLKVQNKMRHSHGRLYLKRDSYAGVFLSILQHFSGQQFWKTPLGSCFWKRKSNLKSPSDGYIYSTINNDGAWYYLDKNLIINFFF